MPFTWTMDTSIEEMRSHYPIIFKKYTHSDSNCGFEPLKIVIDSGLHRLVHREPVFFEKIGYRLSKLLYGAKEFIVSDRFIHKADSTF